MNSFGRASPPGQCSFADAAFLARLAAPVVAAGAIALALIWASQQPAVRAWARSVLGSRARHVRDSLRGYAKGERPFSSLRGAIVGSGKGCVARVLGPPRSALLGRHARTMSIWRAHTWYYPLDRQARSIIAIRFDGDRAKAVEYLRTPAGNA